MPITPDPISQSLRVYASIAAFIATAVATHYGLTVTPEDKETIEAGVVAVLAGVSGALSLISKIRESRK